MSKARKGFAKLIEILNDSAIRQSSFDMMKELKDNMYECTFKSIKRVTTDENIEKCSYGEFSTDIFALGDRLFGVCHISYLYKKDDSLKNYCYFLEFMEIK